jgi:hypothetical protein
MTKFLCYAVTLMTLAAAGVSGAQALIYDVTPLPPTGNNTGVVTGCGTPAGCASGDLSTITNPFTDNILLNTAGHAAGAVTDKWTFTYNTAISVPILVTDSNPNMSSTIASLTTKLVDLTTSLVLGMSTTPASGLSSFTVANSLLVLGDAYAIEVSGTALKAGVAYQVNLAPVPPVPLPSTLMLFGSVLAGASIFVRRRRGGATS